MSATRLWELANAIANCDCYGAGENIGPTNGATTWAVACEYWNTPEKGHLIAASLALDGLACEDLP